MKQLERFSKEYFEALKSMDHPLHKEAMEIRAKNTKLETTSSYPEKELIIMYR